MNFVSLLSGLVKLANLLANYFKEQKLISTGKELQKGEMNSETLKSVEKARSADPGTVTDDELYRD